MVNVEWALRSAWFLNTNLSNLTKFSPRGGFCFPTRISRISRISTPSEFFPVRHSEYRCLQRKKIREICEIRVRLLFLNYNAKIRHFIFPTHRCSLLLTDTHRLSLINIRVLPNGRKYRILAGDWTPCCSWCIHSSATAHRAGCILLSISSDGLLPRPGRNPENRAGLTPAWCNFVNPFSYNVEFSHTDLTDLTDFDSFGVFLLRPNENTRCLQRKNKSARSVRSVCDLNTIRNHDT